MTVCGYNSTMGSGIKMLFLGMYEAVVAKALEEGLSVEAIVRREVLEIPEINKTLVRGRGVSLGLFQGLNIMALRLFEELLELHALSGAPVTQEMFTAVIDSFVMTLEEVEDFNLSIPPAKPQSESAIRERASSVARWIEQKYCTALT